MAITTNCIGFQFDEENILISQFGLALEGMAAEHITVLVFWIILMKSEITSPSRHIQLLTVRNLNDLNKQSHHPHKFQF